MQQGFGLNKDTQVGNNGSAYNQIKEFLGKKYTGMKVGGRHLWYYDKGEWKEKKVAPDKWEFAYNVKKYFEEYISSSLIDNPCSYALVCCISGNYFHSLLSEGNSKENKRDST